MQIRLLRNVALPDLGTLDIGLQDVPDGMAAALIYQGLATVYHADQAPPQVAAVVVPPRSRRARHAGAA